MDNNGNLVNDTFTSAGTAWQWAVDNAGLLPDQILRYSQKTGLSEISVIEALKEYVDKGQQLKDAVAELEKHEQNYKGEYADITAGHNLQAFVNGIAESVNTPVIKSRFDILNNELDGGLYEGLYILGAMPSLGKTTFVLSLADGFAADGKDVLIISLEMARSELMAKSISRTTAELATEGGSSGRSEKSVRDITDGAKYKYYSDAEKDLIKEAIGRYASYANRVYIVEGSREYGVREVRAAVDKHILITGNVPVVVIDYLQMLAPYDVKATEKMNTDKAVMELKRISRDNKAVVICISSYNRANYKSNATMAAFKESGGIEYSADVIFGLQYAGIKETGFDLEAAQQKSPRMVELAILKNRSGKAGQTLKYKYFANCNYFVEVNEY